MMYKCRFLRTAEMLKPPTPGHDGTVVDEYFPHVGEAYNTLINITTAPHTPTPPTHTHTRS